MQGLEGTPRLTNTQHSHARPPSKVPDKKKNKQTKKKRKPVRLEGWLGLQSVEILGPLVPLMPTNRLGPLNALNDYSR